MVERTCVNCAAAFTIEKKRGRPHTKCESCRKVKSSTGSVKTAESPTKITTLTVPLVGKSERTFKRTPTEVKGNARYSRAAFIEVLDTIDFSEGRPSSQEIAELIRGL